MEPPGMALATTRIALLPTHHSWAAEYAPAPCRPACPCTGARMLHINVHIVVATLNHTQTSWGLNHLLRTPTFRPYPCSQLAGALWRRPHLHLHGQHPYCGQPIPPSAPPVRLGRGGGVPPGGQGPGFARARAAAAPRVRHGLRGLPGDDAGQGGTGHPGEPCPAQSAVVPASSTRHRSHRLVAPSC